jgi:hypothetical protein
MKAGPGLANGSVNASKKKEKGGLTSVYVKKPECPVRMKGQEDCFFGRSPVLEHGFFVSLNDTEIIRTSQNGCLFFRKLICNLKTLRLALGDIRKTF